MPPSRPRQSRPRSDVWSKSDWGLLTRDRDSLTIEPVLEAGHPAACGGGLNPRSPIPHAAPLRRSAAQPARPLDPPARPFALQALALLSGSAGRADRRSARLLLDLRSPSP